MKTLKNYSIILFLFSFYLTHSQINSGKIIYGKSFNYDSKSIEGAKVSDEMKKEFNSSMNYLKKDMLELNFELVFNREESTFKVIKKLENEARNNLDLAIIFGGGKGIYYFNKKTGANLHQNEFAGSNFLITKNSKLNWKLSNESKMIGNYKCYKARTTRTIENNRGKTNIPVIAWYVPKLPVNFGPLDYNGLPGLIVELHIDNVYFYIKKIKLGGSEKITIIKPSKGKKVSEEEFNKIAKKVNENRNSLRN